MTLVVGVNYADHDAAAFALGEKWVFGVERERITRFKHDGGFPHEALAMCLKMRPEKYVLCSSYAKSLPAYHLFVKGRNSYHLDKNELYFENQEGYNKWLADKKKITFPFAAIKRFGVKNIAAYAVNKLLPEKIDSVLRKKLLFHFLSPAARKKMIRYAEYDHHYCHAVSAYTFSGLRKAGVLTLDGRGDFFASKVYTANNGVFNSHAASGENDSIGLLYNSFTKALGFRVNSDEGKVEALAAYGNQNNELYSKLKKHIRVAGLSVQITNKTIQKWFDPDVYEAAVEKYGRENCARAVQQLTEDVGVELVQNAIDVLGVKDFAFGGGVFANVIMNMHIFEKTNIRRMYVVHAMGDSGAAAGAAIIAAKNEGFENPLLGRVMPYFGQSYSRAQVASVLKANRLEYTDLGNDWPENVAALVASGKIVCIFHGRMEFGPRALGNRSVLANPTDEKVKNVLNNTIKKRTAFQPFCPSILESERKRLFENSYSNKFMTCAFKLRENFRNDLPAVIHIDGTARPQFVEKSDNPAFFRVLKELKQQTGFGVVLNTSFNLHGRTIVMTPQDAITDFLDCGIPYLCIEGFLVKHPCPKQ